MIEKCHRGVAPAPTITAPLNAGDAVNDEAVRLATFRQSEETRDGRVAPFPKPETQH